MAFSGGVDSSLVAALAVRSLGDRALAVTGRSSALATGELDAAREVARAIGIDHETITTDELGRADYRRNDGFRCYHCKTELYSLLSALAATRGYARPSAREPTPTTPATGVRACGRPRSTGSAIRCSRRRSTSRWSVRSPAGWGSRAPRSRRARAWPRGFPTGRRSTGRRSTGSTGPSRRSGRSVTGCSGSATSASSAGWSWRGRSWTGARRAVPAAGARGGRPVGRIRPGDRRRAGRCGRVRSTMCWTPDGRVSSPRMSTTTTRHPTVDGDLELLSTRAAAWADLPIGEKRALVGALHEATAAVAHHGRGSPAGRRGSRCARRWRARSGCRARWPSSSTRPPSAGRSTPSPREKPRHRAARPGAGRADVAAGADAVRGLGSAAAERLPGRAVDGAGSDAGGGRPPGRSADPPSRRRRRRAGPGGREHRGDRAARRAVQAVRRRPGRPAEAEPGQRLPAGRADPRVQAVRRRGVRPDRRRRRGPRRLPDRPSPGRRGPSDRERGRPTTRSSSAPGTPGPGARRRERRSGRSR